MSRDIDHGGFSAIINGVLIAVRYCFKWGLLASVLGVIVAFPYLYHQVDEQLRRMVEEKLAAHYRGHHDELTVSIRSARLVEGEGIELRHVAILDREPNGRRTELLHVDEVFVRCSTNLEELLTGRTQATRVWVRRPTLRTIRRADGTWNAAKLLPLPEFSERPPQLIVENGTIEVVAPTAGSEGALVMRDVNLALDPPEARAGTPSRGLPRRFEGALTTDFVRRMNASGLIDPRHGGFSISGSAEDLEFSPELRKVLPSETTDGLALLDSFRGRGDVHFRVDHDPSAPMPYRFQVAGQLLQGRIDDPRLPRPLTEMQAEFRFDNSGFVIENLLAISGESALRVKSWQQSGYDLSGPMRLDGQVTGLEIDAQLADMLPDVLRRQWPKYSPVGTIDADVKLSFDGRLWQPEVTVECLDIDFAHFKFPYRIQHTRGQVTLRENVLSLNLIGYTGGQPVRIIGQVFHPTTMPVGTVEAWGEGIPLDEKLFAALSTNHERLVRALNPRGTIDFYFRNGNRQPGEPPHQFLEIGLNRCGIRYESFPYPLSNLQGTLQMTDGRWTVSDLQGTNDTARVTCRGEIGPTDTGSRLQLHLVAKDLPLEEELRDALGHLTMRQLWNDLRLQGMVDLEADVAFETGWQRPTVVIHARPHGGKTSVQPAYFPYRMEILQGDLDYRDGEVVLKRLKATHGEATISGDASCVFRPDGSWKFRLEDLAADRVRFDHDLIRALPTRLRGVVDTMRPTGPVYLRGTFQMGRGGRLHDPLTSAWDMRVGFYQGSLDFGVHLANLHGEVRLAGDFNGQRLRCGGELGLDSVSHRDIQVTQLRGPLWIVVLLVLLGAEADRRLIPMARNQPSDPTRRPRRMTAQLLGGTIYGDASVSLGATPQYWIKATLAEADLNRCAQELLPGRQGLEGKILASVDLQGTGRSLNSMTGLGNMHLRDADIYELPLMIALLKILGFQEPDRTAFSESNVRFRIEGGHIYLDPIEFEGDAISLEGVGEMDFDTAIRLKFRARLGRKKLNVPVLHEILGGASEQIMIIHVTGTLSDPQTYKEAFPGVNQALQQIQADLRKSTIGGYPLQAGRQVPDGAKRLPKKR